MDFATICGNSDDSRMIVTILTIGCSLFLFGLLFKLRAIR